MNHDRLFHKGTGTVQSKKYICSIYSHCFRCHNFVFSGEFGILLIDW